MKTQSVDRFQCEKCRTWYDSSDAAQRCEKRPITQDRGVKVGDTIRIIRGDGQGRGVVESLFVIDKDWGHYAAERYWHTIGLTAKCADSWGHRMLTFDDYEPLPQR